MLFVAPWNGAVAQQRVPVAMGSSERAAFQAEGLPAGAFRIYPTIAGTLTYDDNIYLRADKVADTFITTTPAIALRSQWAVHALSASAYLTDHRYLQRPSQDSTEYGVKGSGTLDVDKTMQLGTSIGYAHLVAARGTPDDLQQSEHPVRFDRSSASVKFNKTFIRLAWSGALSYENYSYEDTKAAGVTVDQSFRDRDVKGASGRLSYAWSPTIALFVSGSGNKVAYRNVGTRSNRSSDGYNALAGIQLEMDQLITGEIGVGYIRQTFKDSRYSNFQGTNYSASLSYRPTALTTLSLSASRNLGDSAIVGVAGVLSSQIAFTVEHELLRNLILKADFQHVHDQYSGISLRDDRLELGLGGRYKIAKSLSIALSYDRAARDRSSGVLGSSYAGNRLSASLSVQR